MGNALSCKLQIIALEPRFLFDGAGAVTAAKTAADGTQTVTTAEARAVVAALAAAVPQAVEARAADPARNDGKKEVAFFDTSVADYRSLVDALRPGVEVELIGGGESGLAQMAHWALTHSGYDAIHLISHGGEAEVRIGTDSLTTATLAETATQAELTTIGAALNPAGDLLIYGCDVGRGSDGRSLLQDIAHDTGADVAASTDLTGAGAQGGDWVLEAATGTIDVSALDFPDYTGTLGLNFAPSVSYTTASTPRGVVVADFNGDGKLDLALATNNSLVSVLLGNGDGTFQTKIDSATGAKAYSIAAADFNGDGKLDLVTTANDDGKVYVLLGNGDGSFQAKVGYAVGALPRFVAVGDLNGDGKIDIAVANRSSNTVSVLLGKGDGTFWTKVDYDTGYNPVSLAIGDVNGDNKADLVVANYSSNTVSVLLGNSNGTFQPKVDYATGGTPTSVAIGDVNADGKLDLVVANSTSNTVSVMLGDGDGTFQPKVDYATGSYPWAVVIGDFSGDGKVDIAALNYMSSTVSVLRGQGDGTFLAKTDYAVGPSPYAIAKEDFNGDGKLDLVTANQNSSFASVLLNISSPYPYVTSINRHTGVPAPTNADTLTFDVTFSTAVTGVSAANFSLSGSDVTGVISSVSGSGTAWTVTVTGVSGDGTLGLDLSAVADINDGNNGPLEATHTSDQTYTVDQTGPTVTSITRRTPGTGVTNADTLVFRVTFSEAVSNLDVADFAVTGTTGTVTGVVSAGGNAYDVTVSGGDLAGLNGTVALAFSGSQNITDSLGNPLTATTPTGTNNSSYTLDNTPPAVTSIVRQTAAGSAAAVVYRVTFSEAPAATPATGDFAVSGTTATVTGVTSVGGNAYDVTISGGNLASVDAAVTLAFANGQTIADAAGNALVPTYTSGVSVASIDRVGAASTKGAAGLDFTVTFNQAVDGVTANDFTVLKGAGVTGTPVITIAAGADGSSTYTVHVAGLAGDGAVELDLAGIGTGVVAHGAAMPIATAATSGQAYTLDNTGPTITSIERQTPSGAYTNADSVVYRVTFNEAVSNLHAADFAVTGTTGTVTGVASAGGNAYDVTVSGGNLAGLNGTITLSLASGQDITDALGNALTITAPTGTDHSTYTIDNTAPTLVSIVRQTTPGLAASVVFRVTFDGAMAATAVARDFTVTGTTGTVTNVALVGTNAYDVTISGGDLATVNGTITLAFASSQTITDAAGNHLDPTISSSYWSLLGNANFTSQFSQYASMAIDQIGNTYVAFNDGMNAGKVTVMKFDGTSWTTVGAAGFSAGTADFISIKTDFQTDAPYLAFRDGGNDGKATVMKFNGTSWETVGTAGFTPGEAIYESLVITGTGTPYLAFQSTSDGKATVMTFDGTNWVAVGNPGFTAGTATYGSLYVNYFGTPYFAFSDGANGGKATVMTFDGSNWNTIGTAGFSAGAAQYLSFAFNGINYVLAYQDNGNGGKATVMMFDGGSWTAVGTPGFTAGAATDVSLAIDYQSLDQPFYVGFRDEANGGKATVMNYNGTGWEIVGSAGFSAEAGSVSFGLNGSTPYLAYTDSTAFNTATVMQLTPGVTLSSIALATAEKTQGIGGLTYTVTFSGAVDGVTADDFTVIKGDGVTGTPTITIANGADGSSSYDVLVTGLSGEGAVALNFSGHGTGVVTHGSTAPVPDSGSAGAAYALDTVAPTVTGVTSSATNGTYKAGDTISIQVTFSEAVIVTGSPRLTLNSAAGGRIATYASGSGTSTLTFTYIVQAGDLSPDLDFSSTTALTRNGGSIKDGTGNTATLTLPAPGATNSLGDNKAIVIDAVAPTYSITRTDLSTPPGTSATFTVTYDGTGTDIDPASIAAGNVTVTAPDASTLAVTLDSWNAATKTATYSFTPPGGSWDEGDAGTYTIGIVGNSVKDVAGNAVAAAASAKTFQVVYGPTVTDPNIAISGATGTSGVFKIGDTVTATWDNSATGDNNSRTITGVTFDFSQFGGGTAVTGTSDGQGHWSASYTVVSGSIDNVANRNVSVTATDTRSLSTTTADGANATVDNSAPAAPPTPVLAAASDSGASNTDGITNVTTPTISGTTEANGTVRVYEGTTLLATTRANGSGVWSVATSALGTGSHTITAIVTDAAGNTGTASAGRTIVIDTTAPSYGVTRTDLTAPSGTSATFTVTYDGTGTGIDPTSIGTGNVTVTGPGNTGLTVTLAAWDAATNTATYSFTPPGGSWDNGDAGTYTIGIVGGSVKDTAGNAIAAAANAKNFLVNYNPIVTDPKIAISGATGTGGVFKIGDTVTAIWDNSATGDDNSRAISGVVFNFSQFGGGSIAGTSDGQGHWTAAYTIVSGTINTVANRNVSVTATNIDSLSTTTADSTNATVDNSAPAAPASPVLAAASDSGWSNADAITRATTPTFGGTAEARSTVRLYEGATLLATTTANSAGTWSVATSVLGAGSHGITATATDAAGNTGPVSAGQTVIVETVAPVSIAGALVVPNGGGVGAKIGVVSASDPGGQAMRYQLTDDADGRFTIDQNTGVVSLNQALNYDFSARGQYSITVRVTDAAGLTSTATLAVKVTLSSAPPVTIPTVTIPSVTVSRPSPPPPTSAISVGTVGATDAGESGGRLISTDAMTSGGFDTGAGNGSGRLITASNMNGSTSQSMISAASSVNSGNGSGIFGGGGFSFSNPSGDGIISGFGAGDNAFGSSLSSGVFGSSLTGGTAEASPARTVPSTNAPTADTAGSRTGEQPGQGSQGQQNNAGQPGPANVPDNAGAGLPAPPRPKPQTYLFGPATRSFSDQLADAAGKFERDRDVLIETIRSAASLIGRDAA